jgi:hypothetical protein
MTARFERFLKTSSPKREASATDTQLALWLASKGQLRERRRRAEAAKARTRTIALQREDRHER